MLTSGGFMLSTLVMRPCIMRKWGLLIFSCTDRNMSWTRVLLALFPLMRYLLRPPITTWKQPKQQLNPPFKIGRRILIIPPDEWLWSHHIAHIPEDSVSCPCCQRWCWQWLWSHLLDHSCRPTLEDLLHAPGKNKKWHQWSLHPCVPMEPNQFSLLINENPSNSARDKNMPITGKAEVRGPYMNCEVMQGRREI